MFRFSAAALLALVASTAAYSVTKPENGTIWDPSQSQVIAWEKVNTDPSTFAITLVHQASQPNTRTLLLDSVDGGAGTVTIQPPNGGWPSGTAYQINFVQDSNHLDSILAQSQQFDIKASTGSTGTSSSAGSSSASSGSSVSRTVTSVSSGSPTGTSRSTNSASSGSASGTATSDDLNPTASGNPNGAVALGAQAGLFGLVALVGAIVA